MAALADLPGLAAALSRDLTGAGIRHALTGAMAMAVHGHVRATRDVDLIVIAPATELPRVFDIVRRHGFEGDDRELVGAIRDRFVATLRSGPVSVEVFVPAVPYHTTVVERAVTHTVSGVEIPVVSVADLVCLKLLWHRAKDIPDVHALVAAMRPAERAMAREILTQILPDDHPRHAELADLLARFGR